MIPTTVNIEAILVANGSAFILLLVLIFSSRKTIRNRLPDNRMFFVMVSCAMLQCVVEPITFLINGNTAPGMRVLMLIFNSLLFINNIFFTLVWTMFCDYKLFADMKRIRRLYRFLAIPAVLVILGGIVNLFTPVFFEITAENLYQRTGLLFYFTYIITYGYLIYSLILIYRNKSKKYLFMPALLFMIPILIGSIVQFAIYGLSTIWVGTAISLTSMYINVQNEVTYIDVLSGLYNRQYMNKYLDMETRRGNPDKLFAGVMLDIDCFKSINDRFGHLTGDDAIRIAGTLLRSCLPQTAIAVRYAGDEFIIVGQFESMDEVRSTIDRINQSTKEFNKTGKKPFSITFSVGYSIFDRQKDTVDSFIDRIDLAMYEDKKLKKNKL